VGHDKDDRPHDAEWRQLNFIPAGSPARKSWSDLSLTQSLLMRVDEVIQ
jgi:hypothetical protein